MFIATYDCYEFKLVKVWDMLTSKKLFSLEGLGAAVVSVSPPNNKNSNLVYSTSSNGKIKSMVEFPFRSQAQFRCSLSWLYKIGLGPSHSFAVHIETIMNQFVVAGNGHKIKVWDVDHVELLTSIDTGGGLTVSSLMALQ
ncbi:hypothetical protein FEM48_Zijuj06G0139000 [Ziziphus jujuba var. spinosa]|uniref:Uncharacterized protein n=1 Tax=Ziziphus jujuba var. spinosa TaxID=714518 RepID=A0A978V9N9_ZIZJJ|nr:hypothetical protein FEM48_Zijuj06G0139000 [Ziziphus jujuba var. spinosa]